VTERERVDWSECVHGKGIFRYIYIIIFDGQGENKFCDNKVYDFMIIIFTNEHNICYIKYRLFCVPKSSGVICGVRSFEELP